LTTFLKSRKRERTNPEKKSQKLTLMKNLEKLERRVEEMGKEKVD